MLISATLSKPSANVEEVLGKNYSKIKLTAQAAGGETSYFGEFFTEKQVFHRHFSEQEAEAFIKENAGITFKNCVKRTETEEITILANKKGKITELVRKNNIKLKAPVAAADSKKKNYLLEEGKPVPFLVLLGVMTDSGKVISSKYDKFRQINRFLEFINDVLPELQEAAENSPESNSDSPNGSVTSKGDKISSPDGSGAANGDRPLRPIRIADFGCGKSYLTFAVHYFLTEVKHVPCEIEGLDLKEDVINYCNEITKKLGLKNLVFHTGSIADYSGKNSPDLVITLHACDTATDYALKYAVERGTKVILSVPCCQHQINTQLQENKGKAGAAQNALSSQKEPAAGRKAFESEGGLSEGELFEPLLKYGLIRERFSALLTDALRGKWLEEQNYSVQMLEFIDIEHTPKNLLIRAVKKESSRKDQEKLPEIAAALKIKPEIWKK